MKIAVVATVAFALSLAATSGAVWLRAPKTPAAADSSAALPDSAPTAPDSAAAGSARNVVADTGAARRDSAAAIPSETAPASHDTARATALAAPPPAPAADSARVSPAAGAAQTVKPNYRQLGRILTNMPAAEAVAVLTLLRDDEVEGILRQVGVRQAAALLAGMPKERAADLSRRLLTPADSGTGQ